MVLNLQLLLNLYGRSFVVGPSGEVLIQLDENPQVKVVDVPIGAVGNSFHNNPLGRMGWGYRRPSVYSKYLSK